jgi:hypothetical protein
LEGKQAKSQDGQGMRTGDPAREWGHFDEEDKAYIKMNYPDDHAKYFSQFCS